MSESSLIKKLAAVMKAVERIPKHGRNTFHNYDYATEADIVAAVRTELANRNVMCLPAIVNREREPVGEKGSVLTHLDMTFTFVDGDSGEREMCPWLGAGTDKEDKGAYKAMTGGEKYFLLKTFLIPTGDDPDQDAETHELANDLPDEPPHPAAQPQDEPTHVAEGAPYLYVTDAKIAKRGTNSKGAWTLYAVRFSNGTEGTTFEERLYNAALAAKEHGVAVDPLIKGKNLVRLKKGAA